MTTISGIVAARIAEDIGLIGGLLARIPDGCEDWQPPEAGTAWFTVGQLRAHLAESLAGICGCLQKLEPDGWDGPLVASDYGELAAAATRRLALLTDAGLTQRLPTVFAPEGAAFLDTLLVNWKHLSLHGHQLFVYLKFLGVSVGTRDLFRFD